MTHALHDDELPIDVPLVRALLDRALPETASLPLRPLPSTGSSNALFRLGDDLLARLPRQPGGSTTIDKEARWLPHVAPRLPVAVPDVVYVGEPDLGYPERWMVVRWLDGDVPSVADPGPDAGTARDELAVDLADAVNALRDIDVPEDASADPGLRGYRGEPLATQDERTRRDIEACRTIAGLGLDLDAVLRLWEDAMALPGVDEVARARWYHGDLLAENLLVRDGRLAAVLDFGGLAVGDPTIDLIAAWEVLDAGSREVFREAVTVDEASWLRGRAWALTVALMTFPYYWSTMPDRCSSRLAMARAVLADAAG
ncbi:MAG TPA: aminoglycoside phosphotransferase family protein [Nocardioidaceae bacterium]|nr:aminoglycoside phosphotransferase family protein [Nocardioidaceae bacterium]